MLVYLDMCCLKRPFDDLSQPRVRLESEAVLALLAAEADQLRFVRSAALVLENDQNPLRVRAARVERWLRVGSMIAVDYDSLRSRTAELMARGLGNFDALHVASAEQARANAFATCDDRLLGVMKRNPALAGVRVSGVVELAAELLS
jgi:predicted nucleic acid-binding protein